MKKIIPLLLIILIYSTGCSVTYDLDIDNDSFFEKITLQTPSSSDDFEFLKDYEWPKPIDYQITGYSEVPEKEESVTYYDYFNESTDSLAKIRYQYLMNIKELSKSAIIHNCYQEVYINKYQGNITLKTGNNFECFSKYPPLDKVTVNIKTNKNVVENNADSISGNTYTWNITKLNSSNKSIYLKISENKMNNKDSKLTVFIIIGSIVLFLIMIRVLYICKNRKYNRN